MAISCPLPHCNAVFNGLGHVTGHLQNIHQLQVSVPHPPGFWCRHVLCGIWYATYKGWRHHIRIRHNEEEGVEGEIVNNEEGILNIEDHADAGYGAQDGGNNIGEELEAAGGEQEAPHDFGEAQGDGAVDMSDNEMDVDGDVEVGGNEIDADGEINSDEDDEMEEGSENEHVEDEVPIVDDSDHDEHEDFDVDNANIKKRAAEMIVNLRSHCTMNRTEVRLAIDGCDSVLEGFSAKVRNRVQRFLENNDLADNAEAAELMDSLSYSSPFIGMRSDKGQVAAAKEHFKFVPAQTLDVGGRVDQVNVGNAQYRQRPVRENFQYVSPKKVLRLIVSKTDVMNHVNTLLPRDDDLLTGYIDGDHFRNHPYFQQYPHAFQLALYYDDFEIVNGEGSKTQIHTIAAFYLLVLNVPAHMNSSLHSIHVVLLANCDDLKSRGFRIFLQPLIDDLRDLESPDGSAVSVNGQQHTVRACLVAFMGDSKAAHEILDFLGCGSRHFCRLCMISRAQLHAGNIIFGPRRSMQLHEAHLLLLQANYEANTTRTGIKGTTCLHDLTYFRYWENYVFDVFHDLTGVAHLVMKAVLRQFVCVDRHFRATDLNRRIRAFRYGIQDIKNRPTANFNEESLLNAIRNHALKQQGSQTFCLMRALPFLLDGLVPDEDVNPYLELIILLQTVIDLALAPRLPRSIMPYFRSVLEDYRTARRHLFPQIPFINKEHHIEHYPECCEKMGPLRSFMCMRADGEHRLLKRHVHSAGSFKNAHMTAMESAQFSQAAKWGTSDDTIIVKVKVLSLVQNKVVNDMLTQETLLESGFEGDDILPTANKVSVFGIDFTVGEFVTIKSPTETANSMHSLGKIESIIIANDAEDVWLEVEEWETVAFDDRLHAFIIAPIEEPVISLLDSTTLPLHPPLSSWVDYTTDRLYLSLKHYVP